MKYEKLIIPAVIILAGILIAAAVIYSQKDATTTPSADKNTAGSQKNKLQTNNPEDNIAPISGEDHILGDPNAPIKIIEFSDTECPFCKQFHQVLHQIVAEYDGQVAWVYRHFPIPRIHPKAIKEAVAAECAGELGGNDKFWEYLNYIFEITPSNNNLDPAELPKIAELIGLDKNMFQNCLDGEKYFQRIANDYNNAIGSGGKSTPYSIVITKDGHKIPLHGTLEYSSVKYILDKIIQEQ